MAVVISNTKDKDTFLNIFTPANPPENSVLPR